MKQYIRKSLRGPISLYARVLVILLVIMLSISSMACDDDGCSDMFDMSLPASTWTAEKLKAAGMHPTKINITRTPRTDGRVEFKVKCSTTVLATERISLLWDFPGGASNVQISHDGDDIAGDHVSWDLPVGPNGQTDEVTISYTPPADVDRVVDQFGAYDMPRTPYGSTIGAVTTELPVSPGKTWGEWNPASPVAASEATDAPQDDYYLWETTMWYSADGLTMTADLCQDIVNALQSDTAFVALRFPVQPPTLVYTDPYTLPVSFRSDASPQLALLDRRSLPATPVITTSLEYKPQYLTFAENELPPAPGEHWLTLGTVFSPTIDCASLPELPGGEWEIQSQVWLDFGGVPGTCAGCTLPLYYCYEGQQPPPQLSRALANDVTSYQGWDITCVGPHYLTLQNRATDWVLAIQGSGWITPTETISFTHKIYNRTQPRTPITFTLELSSTLDAGWAVYADEQGQTPVTGPFVVDVTEGGMRQFWLYGQTPADAADGPYSLIVTARTDDAAPALQQVSDLMWVGDWVSPDPGPLWFRSYLPLVVKIE